MRRVLQSVFFLFFALVFVQCADVTPDTTDDGTTTDVSDDVATNTAAVNEIVLDDTLDELFVVLNEIDDDLDVSTGSDVGDRLTAYASDGGSDTTDVFTVELSDSEGCVEGGTKTIEGQLDYINDPSSNSGTIAGSFTISYSDCQETVTLSPEDQDCGTTPTINGDMESNFDISYGFINSNDSEELDYFLESETNSAGALDITVGATASDQTYSYTHELSDNTTDTNLTGTVEFDGQSYSVTEVSDFISSSTSDVVCTQ